MRGAAMASKKSLPDSAQPISASFLGSSILARLCALKQMFGHRGQTFDWTHVWSLGYPSQTNP
jgi:hypothetical protein